MPTKGSREMDDIAKKATREMGYESNAFEYPKDMVNPVDARHSSKGSIGGGSDTRGKVQEGTGHPGPAEAHEED